MDSYNHSSNNAMETLRLRTADTDDEDPYGLVPRCCSDDDPYGESQQPNVCGERVLYEGWWLKESRFLRQWRRRWMVLTPSKLRSYHSERGYELSEQPTEEFAVSRFHDTCTLDAATLAHAPALHHHHAPVLHHTPALHVHMVRVTEERPVLLAPADAVNDEEALFLASELVTALVNAHCADRTGMPEYALADCMHTFEPRGLVSLYNRYALGAEIGRGTFGVVYRGRCLQSGRRVAIKQVSLLLVRERVREEVELMREIRHPHVVSCLNYLEVGRQHGYLVMELLPGGDLYSQVVDRFRLGRSRAPSDVEPAERDESAVGYSEADVREILRMALSGLSAIHDHQVAHRDLKPENVLLLDRRGGLLDLRIADFGTACRLSQDGQCSGRVGTRGYMAPEVLAQGARYDLAVDLWSIGNGHGVATLAPDGTLDGVRPCALCRARRMYEEAPSSAHRIARALPGVILFTLLCGQPPFRRHDLESEEAHVRSGRCSFADPNWLHVSDEAQEVVRRLLATEPQQRPKAHEALALPWVRPPVEYSSIDDEGSPRSVTSGAARPGFLRVASLPGSASLLELSQMQKHANIGRVQARGEESGRRSLPGKIPDNGPRSAPTKVARSRAPSFEALCANSATSNRRLVCKDDTVQLTPSTVTAM